MRYSCAGAMGIIALDPQTLSDVVAVRTRRFELSKSWDAQVSHPLYNSADALWVLQCQESGNNLSGVAQISFWLNPMWCCQHHPGFQFVARYVSGCLIRHGKFWFNWANGIWPVIVCPTKWLHCRFIWEPVSLSNKVLELYLSSTQTLRSCRSLPPLHSCTIPLFRHSAVLLIASKVSNFSYYSSGPFTVYLWENITAEQRHDWEWHHI